MSNSPHLPLSEDEKIFETADRRPTRSVPVSTPRAGYSAWFGGPNVTVGPRIGPVIKGISVDSDSDDSSSAILDKQIALEDGHAIQYRTCSWQKVRRPPFPPPATTAADSLDVFTHPLDRRVAVFRVHMLGKSASAGVLNRLYWLCTALLTATDCRPL
jgi:hypothetical protein